MFVFFFTLTLYTLTLPNIHTGFADSDEFILAALTHGVVHPPGYPLYTMLTILITSLPLPLTFAGKANLLSALLHAGVVVNVFLTFFLLSTKYLPRLQPRLIIGGASSIFLGTMTSFWFHGLFAEVFSLNNFLISLIVLLFVLLKSQSKNDLQNPDKKSFRLFLIIMSVCGFALSNQQAIILLFPLFVLLLFWIDRTFFYNRKLLLISGGVFVLSFLLPYMYLPIAAEHQSVVNYENPRDLNGVYRSISRKAYTEAYGAAYVSTNGISFSQRLTGLRLYSIFLTDSISWPVVLLVIGGCIYLVVKKQYGVLGMCSLGILGGGLFFSFYSPPAISLYSLHELGIHHRFYLASLLFMTILAGFGGIGLYTLIQKYDERYLFFTYVVLCCIALYQLSSSLSQIKTLQPALGNDYARALLTSLEKNSIVVCFSEPTCFTTLYVQESEKLRLDIVIIPADMKQQSIEQIMNQHPKLVKTNQKRNTAKDAVTIVKQIIEQNLSKRPVYVAGIEHTPAHLNLYGLYNNPHALIPQGCAMKIAKEFKFSKKTANCDLVEKKALSSDITPTLPLAKMFVNYLGYQRFFNYQAYAQQGCVVQAKKEYEAAMRLNPILAYVQIKAPDGTKRNKCLE